MRFPYVLITWIIDSTMSKSIAPCMDTIHKMEQAYYNLATRGTNSSLYDENDFQMWKLHHVSYPQCIGCSKKTQATCPTNPNIPCQRLIDDLYIHCDGVTLPPGYFYNPPESNITGYWNHETIQEQLRIGAAKCGCNKGTFLNPNGFISFISIFLFLLFFG